MLAKVIISNSASAAPRTVAFSSLLFTALLLSSSVLVLGAVVRPGVARQGERFPPQENRTSAARPGVCEDASNHLADDDELNINPPTPCQ